jgi:hypothetical protein
MELRRRLLELGEQTVTMLITTNGTRSWAVYLNDALDEVLAYHGRLMPGPRYADEDDEKDLADGALVRHLASRLSGVKIIRLEQSGVPVARIQLADDFGHRFEVTVKRWRRMVIPSLGTTKLSQ